MYTSSSPFSFLPFQPTHLHKPSYRNVTNQLHLFNGIACNNQVTLFNTTLRNGANIPVNLQVASVSQRPISNPKSEFPCVYGVQVDVAFVEEQSSRIVFFWGGYGGTRFGD